MSGQQWKGGTGRDLRLEGMLNIFGTTEAESREHSRANQLSSVLSTGLTGSLLYDDEGPRQESHGINLLVQQTQPRVATWALQNERW